MLVGCALVALLVAGVQAREWTDATGSIKVEAEMVRVADGRVYLRKGDGTIYTVELQKLSAKDQEFIRSGGVEPAAPQPAADPGKGGVMTPERFDEAIRNNPNDPNAYYSRGLAKLNKKMPQDALADFNKAIELDPKHAAAYDARGSAYRKLKQAAEAHDDFNKAIELNPELASAYKNRGENLSAFYETSRGKVELSEELEKFRKRYHAVAGDNRRKTPWQPLNNTTGNVSGVMMMARLDLQRARELEAYRPGWDRGGYGGHGGHGHGCGCGHCGCGHGPGCGCKGPGAPPKPIMTDPPLMLHPEQVVRGETITLVANPAALAKGLIHAVGPNDPFPNKYNVYAPNARLPRNAPSAQDIERVDFYFDADKNNAMDEYDRENGYLGSDANPADGYMIEVPTDDIPPGNQSFFAVPRGGECPCEEGEGGAAELISLAEMLERAAEQETDLSGTASEAAQAEGLDGEQTDALSQEQEVVADVANEVQEAIAETHPLVADLLEDAKEPIGGAAEQLAKAGEAPGEPSKEPASEAAKNAKDAAERLREAAAMLRDAAENPVEGQGEGEAEPAVGVPAGAQGEIIMGEGGPGAPAPGPGGPGGDGDGGDCDDDDYDDDVDIYIDDDDDIYIDDDEIEYEDERAEEAIELALGYIDDEDYDEAVVVYDRLVEDYPDNYVYVNRRAGVHLLRGGYDYAIRDYDRLIGVHRNRADLYYNRGCAHLAAGRLEDALADFNKSIELNETWNLAYNNRGTTLARMARYKEAIADFSKALEIDPNDHLAYKNRALAYKKMGKLELAEADFVKMRELKP
jgi:tetratricopeptide (TPR) repeat protein